MEPLEGRRLLDAVPLGGEFFVNPTSPRGRDAPAAAMSDSGAFVVVTTGPDDAAAEHGVAIYAQRFDASGAPQGGEFRVSPDTPGTDFQFDAAVAMDADGDFVVTWTQGPFGTDDWDIYARRFAADGSPASDAFRVNTTAGEPRLDTAIAMSAAGGLSSPGEAPSARSPRACTTLTARRWETRSSSALATSPA
jgi:hypothetical protein